MEWLTPTLFLFRTDLPDGGGDVEVIAERWPGRKGECDALGRWLEPDEPAGVHLREVFLSGREMSVLEWAKHETWLLEEARRRWQVENPA